jgi:hypothetical protein
LSLSGRIAPCLLLEVLLRPAGRSYGRRLFPQGGLVNQRQVAGVADAAPAIDADLIEAAGCYIDLHNHTDLAGERSAGKPQAYSITYVELWLCIGGCVHKTPFPRGGAGRALGML